MSDQTRYCPICGAVRPCRWYEWPWARRLLCPLFHIVQSLPLDWLPEPDLYDYAA